LLSSNYCTLSQSYSIQNSDTFEGITSSIGGVEEARQGRALNVAGTNTIIADLAARIASICAKPSWNHQYTLPEHLLAHGLTVTGNDWRMKRFMTKLLTGQPVKYVILGGSISTHRGAATADLQWHGQLQKWLEFTFTECASQYPLEETELTEFVPEYLRSGKACNSSSITLINLAVGASSSIFAEKCLFSKVPQDADLVIIEYSMNAIASGLQKLDTMERRSLERLLRKALLMPHQPAIMLFHTWSPHFVYPEVKYGPLTEDWHNLLLQHYGEVQAVSVRAVMFELAHTHREMIDSLQIWDMGILPNYKMWLHPEMSGPPIYADIMIHFMKRMMRQTMAEMLLNLTVPNFFTPSGLNKPRVYEPLMASVLHNEMKPVSFRRDKFNKYVEKFAEEWHKTSPLPPPLIPNNYEDSDGFCMAGADLKLLVTQAQGFKLVDEGNKNTRKVGYMADTVGATLVIKFDSTLNGHVKPPTPEEIYAAQEAARKAAKEAAERAAAASSNQGGQEGISPEEAGDVGTWFYDVEGKRVNITVGTVEVLFGYLRTYENIGNAKLACISGCSCPPVLLEGRWDDHASQPYYMRINVTPHKECTMQVKVLQRTATNSHKFKIVGVIVSSRPFYFGSTHAGGLTNTLDEIKT